MSVRKSSSSRGLERMASSAREVRPSVGDNTCADAGTGTVKRTENAAKAIAKAIVVEQRATKLTRDAIFISTLCEFFVDQHFITVEKPRQDIRNGFRHLRGHEWWQNAQ